MTFLKNYVILVVGCIFISTFVQAALPDSSLKKTLRFILGLILGVILLSPFAGIGTLSAHETLPILPSASPLPAEQQKKMENLKEQQTQTLFQQTLEQSIQRAITERDGAQTAVTVDCDLNGTVHDVTVISNDHTLPTFLSQYFGIPLHTIHLRPIETP